MKPPEPALPHHRPTVPASSAAAGEGRGETHRAALAFSSSLLRSFLTLRQRQHWKMAQPGWPPSQPSPPTPGVGTHSGSPHLPSAGFWGSPTGKGGDWQRAGAGTPPHLCCSPPPMQ